VWNLRLDVPPLRHRGLQVRGGSGVANYAIGEPFMII
jgi:hypothetical protein